MGSWLWIVIGIAALIALAVVLWAARGSSQRREAMKRVQARELRREADVRQTRATEREAMAKEQSEQAKKERVAAQQASQRADRVDPDTE